MAEMKEKIFNQEMKPALVHENLRWYLASMRRGTHSALTRTEVSGGGAKPWKQKGTGRARAGSNRSPLWRKGGVIFPPKPRDYSYALPVKMRKLALRMVLSEFARDNRVKIVDAYSLAETKTKAGVKYLKELGVEGRALVVISEPMPGLDRAVRNIAGTRVALSKDVNVFDLLKSDWVILDKKSVSQLEERLS
jgi:large subunit ribosomal protein L4